MKNLARWAAVFLVAVGLAAGVASAAPVWQKLETDDFTIYSDASADGILDFAVTYTAFRQVLRELFIPEGRALPRSNLVLFRKGSALKKYGPTYKDDDGELASFTSQVDDAALVVLAVSGDRQRALEMAIEFETIFSLQRVGCALPTWMTQGTGMVLSSLELRKGKCVFGQGMDGHAHQFLNSNEQLPWAKFFATGRGSDEYRGKKMAGVYQAQAWALMHTILLAKNNPREAFATLATKIREKSYLEAVEDVLGVPAKKFTGVVSSHVNVDRSRYERPFDEQKLRAGLKLVPATKAEVHVQLSNILAAAHRFDEADLELNQAIALAPDAVCVKEAEARQALRKGEKQEAVKLYREAIAAGTKNTMAYLVCADVTLDEFGFNGTDYAGGGGPATEGAITEIKQALAINAGNMYAYRLLGRAFYILPKLTMERLADLEPALVRGEEGCAVRLYRALLFERLEKFKECAADLALILDDPDVAPRTKRMAQDRLARVKARL